MEKNELGIQLANGSEPLAGEREIWAVLIFWNSSPFRLGRDHLTMIILTILIINFQINKYDINLKNKKILYICSSTYILM
jgi:hypothetical protein